MPIRIPNGMGDRCCSTGSRDEPVRCSGPDRRKGITSFGKVVAVTRRENLLNLYRRKGYHTCGYVEPLIENLIEAGVDILNPVQPECMAFDAIHARYGSRLSFNRTLGTQTTMPFGTPAEVRSAVFRNLERAGAGGGLFCCPTHVLEPEVPWENVEAYVAACKEFRTAGGA